MVAVQKWNFYTEYNYTYVLAEYDDNPGLHKGGVGGALEKLLPPLDFQDL